jgi:HD-like signal output (HDOD) protein
MVVPNLAEYPALLDRRIFKRRTVALECPEDWMVAHGAVLAEVLGDCTQIDIEGDKVIDVLLGYRRDASDSDDLLKAVNVFTSRRIRSRLEEAGIIPAFPHSARKLMDFRQDDTAGVEELAKIIDADPSLAAQVISWATRAHIGARDIHTVERAINVALGVERVLNFSLAVSLVTRFGTLPSHRYRRMHNYWVRALNCALLAERLALRLGGKKAGYDPGLAYLAGLLHNFGEVVLSNIFPQQIDQLDVHESLNYRVNPVIIQRSRLGVTDEQVGAWISEHWGLPREVVLAIRYHNDGLLNGPMAENGARYAELLNLTLALLEDAGLPSSIPLNSEAGRALGERLGAGIIESEVARLEEHQGGLREMAESLHSGPKMSF